MLIYVIGPLTADTPEEEQANVNRAMDAGLALLKRGHVPIIPHLLVYFDRRAKENGVDVPWAQYMAWDLQVLAKSDAVLYLGPSKRSGAQIELWDTIFHNKTVFRQAEDVPLARALQTGEVPDGG